MIRLAIGRKKLALRVCSAYLTKSGEAALVIAGLFPIDLLAKGGSMPTTEHRKPTSTERNYYVRQRWQTQKMAYDPRHQYMAG